MPKHRRGSVAKAKIARVDAIYFTDQLLDHDVYPPGKPWCSSNPPYLMVIVSAS